MWIPEDEVRRLVEFADTKSPCRADGTVDWQYARQHTFDYIPPGYVEWGILAVGNGDSFGYYWPLGREDRPPIAVTTLHDESALLPVASGLGACLLLMHATGYDAHVMSRMLRGLGLKDRAAAIAKQRAREDGIEFWGVSSAENLLPVDPDSPHLLLLAAKEQALSGKIEESLRLTDAALADLPEYGAALAHRAQMLRRLRRQAEAAQAMLEFLTTPMVFGGWAYWRNVAEQLKRLPDEMLPDCHDPYWQRRKRLTLAEYVKTNPDYLLYEEMVEEYHQLGFGLKAVRMRIRIGEMMRMETGAFQSRYDWSEEQHDRQLRDDITRA